MKPTSCPACMSRRLKPVFSEDVPFLRCRDCRTLVDCNLPTVEEAAALYEGEEYFVKEGTAQKEDGSVWGYSENYLAERPLIEIKVDRVLSHLSRYVASGRLLDVGAGPGFLVASAQQRGWVATGVDLNEWATAYGRDELGVPMVTGTLEDVDFEPASLDAITMLDVVEHVPDPDELLAGSARLLRPGGAIALLTPDAGSVVSRLFGRRWPEVQRRGEHLVLFSVAGLSAALARHGFAPSGWHSIGKTAPVETILSDVEPALPAGAKWLQRRLSRSTLERVIEIDPRTKFVLYARRLPTPVRPPTHHPARLPRRAERLAQVDEAIVEELHELADATGYRDWLFGTFADHVPGARVLEVGAGIGTFTSKMVENGAVAVLAVEPEAVCAEVLEEKFAEVDRVETTRDALPDAPSVEKQNGTFDLVVCQNVLEHIGDDVAAVQAMRDALRPGGHLLVLVPAGPRLFGALDDAYGHWRRYTADDLLSVVTAAGLEIVDLRPMNMLGIAGWWLKKQRPGSRVGSGSLRAYEAMLKVWRPVEDRFRPPVGLSLVCTARRP